MTTHTTGYHDYRSNWLEANKLAIYKSGREAELGTPKNNPVSKLYKGADWSRFLRIASPAL